MDQSALNQPTINCNQKSSIGNSGGLGVGIVLSEGSRETLNKWGELWHSKVTEKDSMPGAGRDGPVCFEPAHY